MRKRYLFNGQIAMTACLAMSVFYASAIDIKDEAGLRAIADDLAGEYTLTADITVTSPWTPIGSGDNPFTGKLNGNGHVIKGITFNDADCNRAAFINSALNAEITKLGLEKVNILGNADTGGLLGKDMGGNLISECYVAGIVSGRDHVGALIGGCEGEMTALENCYAITYSHSREHQAAGLVGTPGNIEISNCYFAGTIWGNYNRVGGIAALIDGGERTEINNCFVASPLIIRQNWGQEARILGDNNGNPYELNNNYALAGSKLGQSSSLRIAESEDATSFDGADKTYAELTDPAFITDVLGWDNTIWKATAGSLPVFAWQTAKVDVSDAYALHSAAEITMGANTESQIIAGGLNGMTYSSDNTSVATVTTDGLIKGLAPGKATISMTVAPDETTSGYTKTLSVTVEGINYDISTAEDLAKIALDLEGDFTLKNDIDLAGIDFISIGTPDQPFTGTLDGKGHIIKNMTITPADRTNDLGLFGVAKNATITNLGIENAYITNGNQDVAGIVGHADCGVTIKECYVANSYIVGFDHVGAIIGGCYSSGEPTLIEDCYGASEILSNGYQVGGIIGTMVNCTINRCYVAGKVGTTHGGSNAGGFVSLLDGGSDENYITNSICLAISITGSSTGRIMGNPDGKAFTLENNYSIETTACNGSDDSEQATKTGLQGESVPTDDLKTFPDFYEESLGWDFENTWKMLDEGYPVLAWQEIPVKGSFYNLPTSITLIEGKGGFTGITSIAGNYGQEVDIEEIGTNYLGLKGGSITVRNWPDKTTETIVRFKSLSDDVDCSYEVPVTLIPASESSFHISTAADLVAAAEKPELDYILDNDIDMTGIEFNGIGTEAAPYSGVFNGQGYSIKNITRKFNDANKEGALFNYTSNATIKNLGLSDVYAAGGKQDIGGLIGYGNNTKVEQCYVTGYVQGNDHVGGIFGLASNCTISNSYVSADICTTGYQVGGLVGVSEGVEITNCYAAGKSIVTSGDAWYQRAGGIIALAAKEGTKLTGVAMMAEVRGGIIGRFLSSCENFGCALQALDNCVYSTDAIYEPLSSDHNSGTIWCYELYDGTENNGNDWSTTLKPTPSMGRTNSELTLWSTYAALGWDPEVWEMPAEGGYPVLKGVKDTTSGVESVYTTVATVKVSTLPGSIVIECSQPANAGIFTLSGINAGQYSVDGTMTIDIIPGIYIVRVATSDIIKTFKIAVK